TETTYFVPLGKAFECWHVRLSNLSGKPRRLSAFTYVEFAGNWDAWNDLINLQYTQHTVKMEVDGNIIDHGTNVNVPSVPDDFAEKDQGRHTFLALTGAEVVAFDTDREELAKVKSYWHERIAGLAVETPDAELNSTLNMWGPFNCLITYAWSRAAS